MTPLQGGRDLLSKRFHLSRSPVTHESSIVIFLIWGLGFRVLGFELRVERLGVRVEGSWLRVEG